jgi:hypothetical protein
MIERSVENRFGLEWRISSAAAARYGVFTAFQPAVSPETRITSMES